MDYSNLSDNQLLALHSGDYSTLSNEELTSLHQVSQPAPSPAPEKPMGMGEYIGRGVTGALPVAGMVAGGAVGGSLGPVGSVGGAAAGYAGGKEIQGLANHYLFGDELPNTAPAAQATRVAGNAATGATGEMGGQVLGAVAQPLLEHAATSPIPNRVADATNLVGKGKDLLGKITDKLMPDSLKPAADVASAIAGRVGAYKVPLTAPIQAVSDIARGASFAQKGLASALDAGAAQPAAAAAAGYLAGKADPVYELMMNSKIWNPSQISRLSSSPYGQVLKNAAKSGGPDGISTTHYILQQTDPQYQELLKREQE